MARHETCACCHARVVPIRPSFAARAAFFGALLPFAAMMLAYPFGGFLWPFIVPLLMVAGMGIGPLVDAAFAPALCPECHRRFTAVTVEEPLPAARAATILRA
jgi:hypothetical protein